MTFEQLVLPLCMCNDEVDCVYAYDGIKYVLGTEHVHIIYIKRW